VFVGAWRWMRRGNFNRKVEEVEEVLWGLGRGRRVLAVGEGGGV
jgi:hypothetical protein